MRATRISVMLAATCFAVSVFCETPSSTAGAGASTAEPTSWSGKAAAAYLDGRLTWWMGWPTAARDHDTFCVSCHTVLPYAMGRPALRTVLAEEAPSPVERRLLDNVTKRVRMWDDVEPFYPDKLRGVPKTAESRGTESIMNAVILTRYDGPRGALSPDARLALDHMWAEQLQTGEAKGAWSWLQFHNAPWEGDSQYYGATLAAIAVGAAPGNYAAAPEIQGRLELLRGYLVSNRTSQTLLDQLILVWASTKIPGLLKPAERDAIITQAVGKQQSDGGFSLSSFVGGWKRHDNTPLETKSDGYATGVVTLVLEEAGVPRDTPELQRALGWLMRNQEQTDGRWLAYSLNKQRDLASDIGRFMSDAATAYAVMALSQGK
jgi:squalene-hopene/tetraprenyl-beta-curcumene cyclase